MTPFIKQQIEFFLPSGSVGPIAIWLFVVYYAASVLVLVSVLVPYLRRAYRTHWYDTSHEGWLGEISWLEVSQTLAVRDPLDYKQEWRLGWPKQVLRDIAIAAFFVAIWILGIHVLHFIIQDIEGRIKAASIVTGIASGVFALVKLFYDQRLKARSQNRQNWINQLRDTTAELIQNLPVPGDQPEVRRQKDDEYFRLHGKLELLINPHEKDHRALMAMFRHAYGYPGVSIDSIPGEHLNLLALDPRKYDQFGALKSQIVRLSNVMLKREWERVKYIQ